MDNIIMLWETLTRAMDMGFTTGFVDGNPTLAWIPIP